MKLNIKQLGPNKFDNQIAHKRAIVNNVPLTEEESDYIITFFCKGCSEWNTNRGKRVVTGYKNKNRYLFCPAIAVDFSRVSCENGIYSGIISMKKDNPQGTSSETTYFQII